MASRSPRVAPANAVGHGILSIADAHTYACRLLQPCMNLQCLWVSLTYTNLVICSALRGNAADPCDAAKAFCRHRFGYQKMKFPNRFRKGLGLVVGVLFVALWTFLVATCREYVPTLSFFHLPFPLLSTHTGTRKKNLA